MDDKIVMAIVFGLLGLVCVLFPGLAAINAFRSGETYVKMKYRPGRSYRRESTPLGFWLGVGMQTAFGMIGLLLILVAISALLNDW